MSQPPQPPYGDPNQPQQPYGQQPYGQPAVPPYGQPAYGFAPPDHPKATTILILGILGLVVCQVLSPVAWVMGNTALREIDASQGRLGGRGSVVAGRICGIIGTVLIILGVVVLIAAIVIIAISSASGFDPTRG